MLPSQEKRGGTQFAQFDKALAANAKTLQWKEVPMWVRKGVSPLARFITGDLQQDLLAPGAQREASARGPREPLVPGQLESFQHTANTIVEGMLADTTGEPQLMVTDAENPYHNAEHTKQVIKRIALLIESTQPPLTAEQAEALLVAGAFHDAEHPGGPAKTRESDNKAYEQRAAEFADKYAKEHGWSLRRRTELATNILGSIFGDHAAVKPYTQTENILKLADIGGYMEDAPEWIEQSLEVAEEYAKDIPPLPFVQDWLYEPDFDTCVAKWLKGQSGFIQFLLEPAHNEYKRQFVKPGTDWKPDSLLQEKKQMIADVMADQQNPQYTDIMRTVRNRLHAVREQYGKKVE